MCRRGPVPERLSATDVECRTHRTLESPSIAEAERRSGQELDMMHAQVGAEVGVQVGVEVVVQVRVEGRFQVRVK